MSRSAANLGGFSNCLNPNCGLPKYDLHKHNIPGNTFMSTVTNQRFSISQSLNCESHNIVYLVSCTKPGCLQQYVGETGRKHKERALEHIRDINTNIKKIEKNEVLKDTPVSRHFSKRNHDASHFSIQVIEKCKKEDPFYRKIRENFWELTLKTQINVIKSHIHDAFK